VSKRRNHTEIIH